MKNGFIGPSKCQLCNLQEETIKHLLNLCSFSAKIWDWVASSFRQINRDRLSVSNTLSK